MAVGKTILGIGALFTLASIWGANATGGDGSALAETYKTSAAETFGVGRDVATSAIDAATPVAQSLLQQVQASVGQLGTPPAAPATPPLVPPTTAPPAATPTTNPDFVR